MQALSQLSYTPQGALMFRTSNNKVSHSIKAKSPEDGALERLRARAFGGRLLAHCRGTPAEQLGLAMRDKHKVLGGADGARTRDPRRDRPVF